MTVPVVIVLLILAAAVLLFVKEWLRADVVALLVLLALNLTGQISQSDALAGFSNPAVITIASVLVLSGALLRTGVADIIGRHVLRVAGGRESRLLVLMMVTAGLLSGVMNDIGVAALMLPVVLDMARRTGIPPSRLLMPLSFSCLLGGLTTLIGTSPNILISGALADRGLRPFGIFDFTPVGLAALVVGVAYMALAGRRLLPARDPAGEATGRMREDPKEAYQLQKVLFMLRLPEDSALAGRTLLESRLGSALGFIVLSITRAGKTILAPGPNSALQPGDKLLVEGQSEELAALKSWKNLVLEEWWPTDELAAGSFTVAEIEVAGGSTLAGMSLYESRFRQRFGVRVLAVSRGGDIHLSDLTGFKLTEGDLLLVLGETGRIREAEETGQLASARYLSAEEVTRRYRLEHRLLRVRVPAGSRLAGKTIVESGLGKAFSLAVLGISRNRDTLLMPDPDFEILEGDVLLLQGRPEDLSILNSLQRLVVDQEVQPGLEELESEEIVMTEVMLSPRTSLAGKTLRELYFREKYGLTVLGIWRADEVFRSNLRDMEIRFGDALLVFGHRRHFEMLARDPDFLVLKEPDKETYRRHKAPVAGAVEVGVLLAVVAGWLPIYIAAPLGAVLMVVTRCLTIEEAYRFVEWKAVVLIAGMLALGKAMEVSGAAHLLADGVLGLVAPLGPLAMVAGLFVITCVSAQVMPTAAAAVLISPLALSVATDFGLSPYALMMVVALASSSSFLSPVGHPVNLLVMGVGGYRFTDYTKVGAPLVFLMLLVALLVLPLIWPLT